MIICYCGDCNEVIREEDLLYIIPKGESEGNIIAEECDIKVYKCSKCKNKIYAV